MKDSGQDEQLKIDVTTQAKTYLLNLAHQRPQKRP